MKEDKVNDVYYVGYEGQPEILIVFGDSIGSYVPV